MLSEKVDRWESASVDLVAKLAPWLAPLPTAYLVGRATIAHLQWPPWVATVAAVIVECLGLATVNTALVLREYNSTKRKSDPGAPFVLALALVGVYYVVATGLTVILDIAPGLATYAPGIFPTLSLVGAATLAIRADHRRRVGAIAQDKAQRRAQRVHRKSAQQVAQPVHPTAQQGAQSTVFDVVNATRRERKATLKRALLDAYKERPEMGATEAGRLLGVHRNTVYTYTEELETAGRLRKNGGGWEVVP